MARWVPAEEVKAAELVGRRVFDSKNASLSEIELGPNLFFDTRFQEDLSLDRLGEGQPHKETIASLTKLCDQAGAMQSKLFAGWFATQKKHVKFEKVTADPLTVERHGVDNPFHALLDRSAARERAQAFHLSRSLLMAFKETGQLVDPVRRIHEKQ